MKPAIKKGLTLSAFGTGIGLFLGILSNGTSLFDRFFGSKEPSVINNLNIYHQTSQRTQDSIRILGEKLARIENASWQLQSQKANVRSENYVVRKSTKNRITLKYQSPPGYELSGWENVGKVKKNLTSW